MFLSDLIIFMGIAVPLLFTVMVIIAKKQNAHESVIWSFLTTYLLYTSLIFLIFVFSEATEFLEYFYGINIPEGFRPALYLYIILPFSVIVHAYGVYRMKHLFEFSIEDIDLKVVTLPLAYSIIVWVFASEVSRYPFIFSAVEDIARVAFLISLPILIALIYLTVKEKKFEEAIIQSPINSIDKIAGVSLSFVALSSAVMMKVYGYENVYDVLEGFTLFMFILSGELYRRTIFSLRSMF